MKGLQLILTIMCSDQEVERISRLYKEEHQRRLDEATQAMRQEMRRNGNNVLRAAKKVFHSKCDSKNCKGEDFERQVLDALKLESPPPPSGERKKLLSDYHFEGDVEKALKKELDRALEIRNGAAYQLIQQHFARAHAKRLALGDEALEVDERLLCDFESVSQLKISKDPALLFYRVAQWLHTRIPDHCRSCGKKATIKCGKCGQRCFCSIQCQVQDETNRVFCHDHECSSNY